MHGAGGQHKNAVQALRLGARLDALEQALAVALALAVWRHGERGHLAGALFSVGVERRAAKDHAVVFDDGVVARVALDLGAVAFDQGAVFLKRLNQRQDAAHIVHGGLAHALELFVHHHGANAVVGVDLQQQTAVHRKRQDVAALHAAFASPDAVLQVKRGVGGLGGRRQVGQQALGICQRQFGIDITARVLWVDPHTRDFAQENQFVGLQRNRH